MMRPRSNCLLVVCVALALSGCRNQMRYELVERDLRWQEDEIYFLEDQLEDAYAQLESCRRENQTLREDNDRLQDGGRASGPGERSRGSRAPTEMGLPPAATPSVELGQPSEAMPPLFRDNRRPTRDASGDSAPSFDGPPLIDPLPPDEGPAETVPAPQGRQAPPDFAPQFGRRSAAMEPRQPPVHRASPAGFFVPRRRDSSAAGRNSSEFDDSESFELECDDCPPRSTAALPMLTDRDGKTGESRGLNGAKLLEFLGVDQPPEKIVAGSEVTQVTINRLITGGHNTDGHLGDEGMLVVVEPRNAAGQVVNTKAKVSIVVLDPAERGAAARVARWDFAPGEAAGRFKQGVFGKGMQFDLPWPNRPPEHASLRLYVRLTTEDERMLEAERPVVVQLCPRPIGGWTAAAHREAFD